MVTAYGGDHARCSPGTTVASKPARRIAAGIDPRQQTVADFLRTEPSRSVDFTLIWVFCPLLPELDRYL